MKYDALQQAAVEASVGLREIVEEIDRLEAREKSLLAKREALQAVGHHLLSVMSMIAETKPAPADVAADSLLELPVAEMTSLPEPPPELAASPRPQEEKPSPEFPAAAFPDVPGGKWPSLVELLARSKPSSLRDEGWQAVPPATHLELRALARAAD